MIVCERCGRAGAEDARFCSGCGASLAGAPAGTVREERKVVTVLFADLVGFTSRAETLDPEDVRATLSPYYQRLRTELERRGGTVEKFIGDAVMAIFGAPVTHEDDPERAVRAALAIRDVMREGGRLQVRIAVTTGEALVSVGAGAIEGEGMAAGDVVNTAARLQSSAPVNGVLVDETTYRATRDRIGYEPAEPVTAKGKAEPVLVWEAGEAHARLGADGVRVGALLVGRRRELDLLVDTLARVREERSPQLMTLVGVPGIGKSRLVFELHRILDAEPALTNWRLGRSLPYGEGATYWALAEMVKAQAGILESDTPEEADSKLAEMVHAVVAEGGPQILESLRPLVGLEVEGEPGGDRTERFAAWRRLFEALAEQRPTVLVFEDLHWAGDDLLDFVDQLVDWASDVPLLVVCTGRPELFARRGSWGGGKPNSLTLSIPPLSDDDTARLLGALLDQVVLPVETRASLLARAGGNPLYAEQFARLVAEPAGEEFPLPETVQGIIAARLDGLPAAEKQLLQDAAVVGNVFWIGAASAVGKRERDEVEGLLHALERKEFVRRRRRSAVAGEDECVFRHVLVRDVAYGQMTRGARAERHERAAAWIEALGRPEDHAETVAHHYLEALRLRRGAGQQPNDQLVERARAAARSAGERALTLGGYAPAARFYEAALELWPAGDPARPELLLAYSRSRVDDAGFDEGLLEEAASGLLRAGDAEAAAEAQVRLAGLWRFRGDRDKALRHLELGARLVEKRQPSAAKAFVLQELARSLMLSDENRRAIQVASQSLRLAERFGLEATRARNLNTIGCARVRQGEADGLRDLEQAIAIAARVHSHEEYAAANNLSSMLTALGDLRRAGELHEKTRRVATRLGLAYGVAWQRGEHVLHCYWDGRWEEALATADEFIREFGAGSGHYMLPICHIGRGRIRLARGQTPGALDDARRASDLAHGVADPQQLSPVLAFAAWAFAAAGDRERADAFTNDLVEEWTGEFVALREESVDAAWAFASLGRGGEFRAALDRSPGTSRWCDAGRQIVDGEFARAADLFAEIGSVPAEGYARLQAAERSVHAGRRADAERQLTLALPVFARLGASAWSAQGAALLHDLPEAREVASPPT